MCRTGRLSIFCHFKQIITGDLMLCQGPDHRSRLPSVRTPGVVGWLCFCLLCPNKDFCGMGDSATQAVFRILSH